MGVQITLESFYDGGFQPPPHNFGELHRTLMKLNQPYRIEIRSIKDFLEDQGFSITSGFGIFYNFDFVNIQGTKLKHRKFCRNSSNFVKLQRTSRKSKEFKKIRELYKKKPSKT